MRGGAPRRLSTSGANGNLCVCPDFMKINLINIYQLKGIHNVINIWQVKLGVHWDDKKGCDISPEMEGVWDTHMQVRVGF